MTFFSPREKRNLELILDMRIGYVLDFTDWEFNDLFRDIINLDITEEKYKANGGSKAKRLRSFWQQGSNQDIAKITKEMLTLVTGPFIEKNEYSELMNKVEIELGNSDIEHLDDLEIFSDDDNLYKLGKGIKRLIDDGKPEEALDRLHTYTVRYFTKLCEKHDLVLTTDQSLNAIFKNYSKLIIAKGYIKTDMSQDILKFSINLLSKFNYVRNNHSFAHDNELLNMPESMLIYENIYALIKFVKSLEE